MSRIMMPGFAVAVIVLVTTTAFAQFAIDPLQPGQVPPSSGSWHPEPDCASS